MTVSNPKNIFQGTVPQLLAVLTATFTALGDGMQYGWSAPVLPILFGPNSPMEVSKHQGEWLESCVLIGAFIGLWLTMFLVNTLGRKRSMLLAAFVNIGIWLTMAFAPRIEYIIAARGLSGATGNMVFVAIPMYVAEIAEPKIRGFMSSLIFIISLLGVFLVYAIVPFVPIFIHCIGAAVLMAMQFVLLPFVPESPYFFIIKGQQEKARKSLLKLRSKTINIDEELKEITAAVERQEQEKGRFQDLFLVRSNRKSMAIMTLLNTIQHFGGVSVMLMNLHSILEAAGSVYMDSSSAGILFAGIMVVAASIASFFIDKFGRKTLLISSGMATGTCLLVLAIYFSLKHNGYDVVAVSWIPIACVMIYAFVFKSGLGLVPIVLTAEIFSTNMKAYGMTLADGVYVVAGLVSLQVYQRLTDVWGIEYPFFVFSICCYSASIFTYLFIPETKGKSLEEIQLILKK